MKDIQKDYKKRNIRIFGTNGLIEKYNLDPDYLTDIFEMSEAFRGKLPYWYMYAAHGFTRPIIPLVSPQFAKEIRIWYNEHNVRQDRMPVQREVFKLLKKQERA